MLAPGGGGGVLHAGSGSHPRLSYDFLGGGRSSLNLPICKAESENRRAGRGLGCSIGIYSPTSIRGGFLDGVSFANLYSRLGQMKVEATRCI
jgi:hypothetical protein